MERFEGNDLMATLANFIESTAFGALNNFLSTFHDDGGYALPSHYEVVIIAPRNLNNAQPAQPGTTLDAARKVSLRCDSVDLPGRALTIQSDPSQYGVRPNIVSGVTFSGSVAMTFQSSSDLEERVFFERWQELAWKPDTWNVGFYDDYVSKEVDIYVMDRKNVRRYGIRLRECFPIAIGTSTLNYDAAGDIIKIPVTMQYRHWETLDITNTPPNLLERVLDTVITGAERSINAKIPQVLNKLGN